MAPAATRRRLACRARRVRRERGRRAGGAWVRRTRSDGRAPRSCVRSARFVSSAIRVGIPEADWADLGAAAELTPSGARDARSGRRTSCPVDLAVQQSDDPLAGESSTRHGSAQRLATVPLRHESGRDGRRSRLGRKAGVTLGLGRRPRGTEGGRLDVALANEARPLLQTRDDLHGFTLPADAAGLIDHVVVPLSLALADAVITHLRGAAMESGRRSRTSDAHRQPWRACSARCAADAWDDRSNRPDARMRGCVARQARAPRRGLRRGARPTPAS